MPINISSKDNERVKYTKSLLKSKNRQKESKYIIEGYRILTLAIECNADLDYVFINETFEDKEEHRKILNILDERNINVFKTTNKIFKELIDTENTQGILGVVKFKDRKIEHNIKSNDEFVLILDRIQDPGNMGTIIRTADSAGVDAIIALKGCVDIYNPKVIRSTMGSIFDMNIIHCTQEECLEELKSKGCVDIYNPKVIRSTMGSIFDMNIIHCTQEECLEELKSKDFKIVSSYLDTDNYYHETKYHERTALVIGNEANGVNDDLIKQSDILVKIPIYGNAESLNAAISSAILMYEIKKYLS